MSLDVRRISKTFYFSLPLYVLVPLALWFVFAHFGAPMRWTAFGIGALGWLVALWLRAPLGLLGRKMPKDRATNLVVLSSGPLEEGVRLVVLLLTLRTFTWAASLGQGWAAVEVLFAIVQGIAMTRLLQTDAPKAQEAKALLETQGASRQSGLWGVVERIFASAYHIGSTLLIAWNPWLVLLLVPVHSLLNVAAMRFAKRSIARTIAVVAVVGTIVLAAGLAAYA